MGEHIVAIGSIGSVAFSALEGFTSIIFVHFLGKIIIHKLT